MRSIVSITLALALIMVIVSCGDKGVPPGEDIPTSILEITAGNNQSNVAGAFLPDSFAVRVVTSVGTPVVNDTVRFSQITPIDSAEIIFEKWPTDANGYAFARYRLDTEVGSDTIKAVSDAVGEEGAVFFAVNVLPGPATSIEKVSPLDVPTGMAGQPLSDPIVVLVKDKYGNPTSGGKVHFTTTGRCIVATDSSALHPFETDSAYTVADDDGIASASWILSVNPAGAYPAIHQLTAFINRVDIPGDTVYADSLEFAAWASDPGVLKYYNDIRPIFADNCFLCHGQAADTSYRVDYYFLLSQNNNLIPGDTNSNILVNSNPFNHFGNVDLVEEDKIIRWVVTDFAAPGSSGLNSYNSHMKSIIDASCVTCHSGSTPDGSYLMTTHEEIRGSGGDAVPNAIPGSDTSLVVQKMQQRHNWQTLDPDSVTAAGLADSIAAWIVDDFMREY